MNAVTGWKEPVGGTIYGLPKGGTENSYTKKERVKPKEGNRDAIGSRTETIALWAASSAIGG